MARFWVSVSEAVCVKYKRILVEASDFTCAEGHAEESRVRGGLTGKRESVNAIAFNVQPVSDEDEDAYEAVLPDGTRCQWDERLRAAGALRVPKVPDAGEDSD
jgi:hypothetical protein